jgi:fungal STAND N-terminal Goodbye domain
MSSISASSTSFQSILDAALEGYAQQTGIDLTCHPSAEKVQNCHSPEEFVQLLREREAAFKNYRDKYRKLIDCLRPVVQFVHAFSGVFGEAAAAVPVSSVD